MKSPDVIENPAELLQTFRERDRKHVVILKSLPFPLELGHYFAWTEPSGARVYLVFKKPEWPRAIGVVFRRDQAGSATSSACMCEWCHAYGPSDQVGLLTATVDSRRRVGLNLCLDLGCIEKIETAAHLSGQDAKVFADKHRDRMAQFCRQALGLVGRVQDYF